MINKIIEALPAIKTAAIKGAALAAYVVDTMRDLRKKAFVDPVKLQPEKAAEDLKAEITQLRAEIQALTKALNDLKNTILIAN